MAIPDEYLGHPIKIKLAARIKEVIFAGWFLDLPMGQILNDEGYLTGELFVIKEKDIVELPPLIGEPPAIYCAPNEDT